MSLCVFVLSLTEPNLDSRRHMHVVDLDFVYDSQQTLKCLVKEHEIQDLTPPPP